MDSTAVAADNSSHSLHDARNKARHLVLSKAEWEELRPIITRLYIDQDLTLTEVIKVIAQDYGFIPTYVQHAEPHFLT